MRIRDLRKQAPHWSWAAERYGMGWRYRGERAGRTVQVFAVAMLCGPGDDDFATKWFVDDGTESVPWSSWWISEAYEQAPYVCPGCHTVGGGPCAPGCIDAEMEAEREWHREHDEQIDGDDWDYVIDMDGSHVGEATRVSLPVSPDSASEGESVVTGRTPESAETP